MSRVNALVVARSGISCGCPGIASKVKVYEMLSEPQTLGLSASQDTLTRFCGSDLVAMFAGADDGAAAMGLS